MEIKWHISRTDVAKIKAFVRQQANNALVRDRKDRNLAKVKPQVQRERFWSQMVSMRLTSVQRSGPNSHVARFIRSNPFPLAYKLVCAAGSIETLIAKTLKDAGGIRFSDRIARDLSANFRLLETGEWARALQQCNRLTRLVRRSIEQEVAEYVQETFNGFGPKQARNLLQALGLTRYEIPIDSRVTRWLNEFGFPIELSAAALGDSNYYNFVSEGIRTLCERSGVFPCILDAAIFASKDGDSWTDANVG